MSERSRSRQDGEGELLSEAVKTRVLARASELDALRATGATVSELRAAATEAGISADAFDEALAELRNAESQQVAHVEARPVRHRLRLWASIAVVALVAIVFVAGRVVPNVAPAPRLIELTLPLRCLTSAQAADLLRPVLRLPTNTIVLPPQGGAVVIRATPAQIENARTLLDRAEREAPACPTAP